VIERARSGLAGLIHARPKQQQQADTSAPRQRMQSPVISAHLLIKSLLSALVGVEDGWRVKSKPAAEQRRKRRGRGLQELESRG